MRFWYVAIAYVLCAAALALAGASEPPQVLVALLDRPGQDSQWRLITDLEAAVGSEYGPSATAFGCVTAATTRLPMWLSEHLPGSTIEEWQYVPVQDVERFMAEHRKATI